MKKIKLLLAAIAAMIGLGANAQSWTASEVGAGQFVLYNVGAGQYFMSGNDWGSRASITSNGAAGSGRTITIEAVGNYFKLRTDQNGSGYGLEVLNSTDLYNDQSRGKNSTWMFEQVATDNGPVYTIKSVENHNGGGNYYMTANSNNTVVMPTTNITENYSYWKLLDAAKVPLLAAIDEYQTIRATVMGFAANTSAYTDEVGASDALNAAVATQDDAVASATTTSEINDAINVVKAAGNTFLESVIITSGFDITNAWIVNPAPGISGSITGWTNSGNPGLQNQLYEYWNVSAGSTKQTLTNLPKGAYKLTVIAYTRDNMTATLYAGEATTNLVTVGSGTVNNRDQGSKWIAQGNGVNNLEFTLDEAAASLEIGLIADNTTGDHWMCWRSFTLTYYGDPINMKKAELAEAVAAAAATEGTIPTAAYEAIDAVVTANNKTWSSDAEYDAAVSAINAAVSTYASSAIVSSYSNYKTMKATVEALDDDATIYTGDATIDLSEIDAPIQATTTLEALNTAIETAKPQMQAAVAEFLTAVTVNDGKRFDITNIYLTNADFEVPTANGQMPPGWTITIGGANCGQQNRTDTNPETGLAITNFIEAWHWSQITSGVIAQTVNSLPEGTYVLECDASVCHDPEGADDITGTNLFVQSSLKKEVSDPISNVRLRINHYAVEFVHGGVGSVTFGLEANNTNANWLSADNFKVYYAGGVDLSIYADALADAVAEFEALEASSAAANYATYKAIVDENNTTWSNSVEYQAAIDAVHAAIAGLKEFNAAEAAYKTALEAAKTTVAKEDRMRVSVRAALNTTIETYEDGVDVTSKDDLEAATAALNAATAKAESSIHSYAIIASGIVPDDSLEGWVCENEQTFHINTWSVEGNPGNDPSGMVTPFIENWIGKGGFLGAGKVYYRLENLEPGEIYRASALVRSYNEASTDAPNGPNFYVNDAVTDLSADGTTFTYNNMSGIYATLATGATVDENGCLELGVVIDEDRNYNWVAFKNVRIQTYEAALADAVALVDAIEEGSVPDDIYSDLQDVKTAQNKVWANPSEYEAAIEALETAVANAKAYVATPVAYDEAANNTIEAVDNANVTITRTIEKGFNTVVLPFDLTSSQVEAAFGAGTKVYEFSENSENANEVTINFNEASTITANVPVLIDAPAESASQVFKFVQIVAAEQAKVEGNFFEFVGTYSPADVAEGDYLVGVNGAINKCETSTNINAFRAYLKVKAAVEHQNVKLVIGGKDYTTAILGLDAASAQNGAIFNIAGQRVSKAQKGIFIVNGKKVVIK